MKKNGLIKVSEIRSFFFLNIGLKIFRKVYYILPRVKVYSDSGNSVTYGFITIWDKKGVSGED